MHSNSGGCAGGVWGEDQGAPVLAIVVRCIWGTSEDIVPSIQY